MRALAAGGLYVSVMFALGFALGPLRIWLVEPYIGGLAAVLVEAPLLLLGMLLTAPRAIRWAGMPEGMGQRLVMGATAAAWMLVFEILGDWLVRGATPAAFLRKTATLQGEIGLALVILLAAVPILQRRRAA